MWGIFCFSSLGGEWSWSVIATPSTGDQPVNWRNSSNGLKYAFSLPPIFLFESHGGRGGLSSGIYRIKFILIVLSYLYEGGKEKDPKSK